jgi:hypothetical protein
VNRDNPYYILEVSPEATPGEIERQGRKILGLLDVGDEKASRSACPLGAFPRDATMVRDAIAALRDPKRRLREATLVRVLGTAGEGARTADIDAPLEGAFAAAGYPGL